MVKNKQSLAHWTLGCIFSIRQIVCCGVEEQFAFIMSRKVTIVNYYGSQDDSRCGYCSNTNTSQSHGTIELFTVIDKLFVLMWKFKKEHTHTQNHLSSFAHLKFCFYFKRHVGPLYDCCWLSGFDWSRYWPCIWINYFVSKIVNHLFFMNYSSIQRMATIRTVLL